MKLFVAIDFIITLAVIANIVLTAEAVSEINNIKSSCASGQYYYK